ncbi:MAG: sulfotransferase [Phycisphaerales bacterium]
MQSNPQTNPQTPQATPKDFFEQAKQLLAAGDVFEASKRAGKLRAHFPEEPPILAIHGITLAKLGIYGPAIADMRTSSELTLQSLQTQDEEGEDNPARPRIVDQYIRLQTEIGRSLVALGDIQDGKDEIQLALDMDPDRPDVIGGMAEAVSASGDTDGAYAMIDDAMERKLDEMTLMLSYARVIDQAADFDTQRATACKDSLAKHVQEIGLPAGLLATLLRAHGTICDRLGEYQEAFNSFRRAAKLRRGGYNAELNAKMTNKVIENWTPEAIDKLVRPEGEIGAQRVLLCGSIHSGSPEVESLLEELPNTISTGPIESLGMICSGVLNSATGVLRAMVPSPEGHRGDQLNKLAMAYAQQCDAAIRMHGMRTVDTHPHNIPLAGCLAMAMRGVTVIQCRRDPVEHTLAIYCDEMAGNHPYTGDLISTASYIKDSERLMDHWTSVLNDERVGARVINIQYEQILSDPEGVLRQLAESLGADAGEEVFAGLQATTPKGPGSHASEYGTASKQLREFFGAAV